MKIGDANPNDWSIKFSTSVVSLATILTKSELSEI